MFSKHMIAPCGLDCNICSDALRKERPCLGCNGPIEYKPDFCGKNCNIVACETRKSLSSPFCDSCPNYPCKDIMEKEIRYANEYPMVESAIGNLDFIRKHGIDQFLTQEKIRWTCPECGGVICVHTGICSGCGASYTIRQMTRKIND